MNNEAPRHEPAPVEYSWSNAALVPYERLRMPQPTATAEGGSWDLLRKLWRRKGMVVGLTAALMVVGVAICVAITPRFTAETRVMVGIDEPHITSIEAVLKGLTANAETVESEGYVIASSDLARQVGYRLALDKSKEFNPALDEDQWYDYLNPARYINIHAIREWLSGDRSDNDDGLSPQEREAQRTEAMWQKIDAKLLNRIDATPLTRSHVLSIRAQSEDPVLAARIANTFAETYIQQQVNRKRQASSNANEWLESRIAELQKQVQDADRAVEAYRRENGLYETKNDTVIAQQLATLNASLVEAENAKAQAEARLVQAKGAQNNPEALPAVLQSPNIQMLRSKQVDLQREAADLEATYTKEHPKVQNIKAQLADVNGQVRSEMKRIVESLQGEAAVANDRYNRSLARLNDLQKQMGLSNDKTIKLRDLEREAEASQTMLTSLLQRSKEISDPPSAKDASDATIISRANVPLTPSFPPTVIILVMATAMGLVVSVLTALLIENLDQTFRTAEEIEEYTGLPALALLPKIDKRQRRVGHVVRNPYSAFTEGLRMLSARLSLRDGDPEMPGLVMFTSALPGEGKSFTSAAFAQLCALEGRRVILLDLDWRKPMLHRMFGQPSGPGLVELLNREVDAERAIYRDPQSGAHVMFTGNVGRMRDLSTRIETLRMLLKTLSKHYDVIILDTPPVMFSPEVLYLARMAEKIVLNVKWASTPRRAVASEIKNLIRAGAPTPGLVLAQIDPQKYGKYSYDDGGYLKHRYIADAKPAS